MQKFTHARGVSGIYVIVHVATGKAYIGSSADIGQRWLHHRGRLRRGIHSNPRLQMAWDGFGEDAFRFLIVERIPDLSLLRDREQWWLDEGETHKPGVGYNLSSQSRMKGFRFTPEQCARLSASLKGKPKSPEYVAAMKLRPVTEGQIASGRALGLRGKGVPKTKAHNRKNGLAQRGSKNHAAKLTEADVIEIHWLLAIGEKSNAKIGRIYGIAATTVHSIRHGKSWPHLKPKY